MDFFKKLLDYYHLSNEDYETMTRPLSFDDIRYDRSVTNLEPLVTRIRKAINNKEKIIVYGDYDCDGIMSVSIIVKLFELIDYSIGYYVPSRYLDGYGLNVKRVEEIAEKGYTLIITVDNGISAFDAIDLAKEKGIDTLVIDHHEVQDKLPNGDIPASGGFMSFVLSMALLNVVNPYLLSLAAISTISDMMPLLGYNRDIVRLALRAMNKHQFSSLNKLTDGKKIDEKIIAMEIAPKINAVGRMDETTNINRLIKFFVSSNYEDIEAYGEFIKTINDSRKEMTKDVVSSLDEIGDEPGIVLNLNIKEGLIGLIANRLVSLYRR